MGVPLAPSKRNTPLIIGIVAGFLVLCLGGLCVGGVVAFNVLGDDAPRADDRLPASLESRLPLPTDEYSPPPAAPTTEAPPPPAPARVGDCIAVDVTGDFQGIGNCNGSRGTYRVLSVDRAQGTCTDPDGPYITTDGYRLCLELYLVRTYCYTFPKNDDGFITGAPKCKVKGTVHVLDIVPGAKNGDRCSNAYKWNHWYRFTHPTVVYYVMQY